MKPKVDGSPGAGDEPDEKKVVFQEDSKREPFSLSISRFLLVKIFVPSQPSYQTSPQRTQRRRWFAYFHPITRFSKCLFFEKVLAGPALSEAAADEDTTGEAADDQSVRTPSPPFRPL